MKNNKPGYNMESGSLIHELPKEFMGKTIRILPKDMRYTFIDESRMKVSFVRKKICDEFIRRNCLDLDSMLFDVFSTLISFTVFGIHPGTSKETVESYLQAKGLRVYDFYQIGETNNYRIILDIPELFANIELNNFLLDGIYGHEFSLEIYCRVCHREGHKQGQCQHCLTEDHAEYNKANRCVQLSLTEDHAEDEKANRCFELSLTEDHAEDEKANRCDELSLTEDHAEDDKANRCVELSLTEDHAEDDKANRCVEECLKIKKDSEEGNVLRPSLSEVHNTRDTLEGIQSSSNLPSRENAELTVATPNTSSTPAAAENLKRRNRNMTTRKIAGVHRRIRIGGPNRGIIKSIMDAKGDMPPRVLLKFVELVYKRKKAIECAKEFAPDISSVIKQIRSVISHYNHLSTRKCPSDKDIEILEDLCKRLSL